MNNFLETEAAKADRLARLDSSAPAKLARLAKLAKPAKLAKLAKLAVIALTTITMILALTACADNSEQVIIDGLDAELAEIKNPDSKTIQELKTSLDAIGAQGIDVDKFVASWVDGYEYKIGAVKIEQNTASVIVDITIKQLGPVLDVYMEEIQVMATNPDFADLTEEEKAQLAIEAFMDGIGRTTPITTTLQLECILVDKTWQPDVSVEKTLLDAFIGKSQYLS